MMVSDYAYLGELHNGFMSNMLNNYSVSESVTNKYELFDDITVFNVQFAKDQITDISSDHLGFFSKYKSFLDKSSFSRYCVLRATRSSDDEGIESLINNGIVDDNIPSVSSMLDYLYDSGVLEESSFNTLNTLVDLMVYSIEGQISDANFERRIDGLIEDFNAFGYSSDDYDGLIVASVLAISKSSLEWWKENPEASTAEDKMPQVVAADLAGAVTGAVIDAIVQGGTMIAGAQDSWNWAETGWAALGGAVDGSLGISSKLAKVLGLIKK